MTAGATRFVGISPVAARLVLGVLVAVTALLLLLAMPMEGMDTSGPGKQGDLETYSRVVERLRGGEAYYSALHTELLAADYGTRSVFNWRPPFFLSMIALLPSEEWARGVLMALAAVGLGLGAWVARRGGTLVTAGVTTALLAAGLLSAVVPRAELACEVWAGVLILISASAYGLSLRWLGLAAALLALLTREIAAPYAVVCVVLALRERRWAETGAWAVGLIGFAIYYGWHALTVLSLIGPADRAYPEGWLQFGGLGFDLGTATFNGLFLLLPVWVTALYLPLALLGLVGWSAKGALRMAASVLGFLVLFACFGKPDNLYWGSMYTPLLALGLPWALPALSDLWGAALGRRAAVV
jgi:hypothetical protein